MYNIYSTQQRWSIVITHTEQQTEIQVMNNNYYRYKKLKYTQIMV